MNVHSFSQAFLSSRLARPIHRHPDQNTTADFQTRLKYLQFRQLPRLTASRPLHEETPCVRQLRRQSQCGSNQPSSSVASHVQYLMRFAVFVLQAGDTCTKKLALSHVSDLSQICMSGFTCRQLIHLVHEALFSTLLQHRSLLLIHRLQVALGFAVVFRCRTTACRSSTRFIRSASSSSGSSFVV